MSLEGCLQRRTPLVASAPGQGEERHRCLQLGELHDYGLHGYEPVAEVLGLHLVYAAVEAQAEEGVHDELRQWRRGEQSPD